MKVLYKTSRDMTLCSFSTQTNPKIPKILGDLRNRVYPNVAEKRRHTFQAPYRTGIFTYIGVVDPGSTTLPTRPKRSPNGLPNSRLLLLQYDVRSSTCGLQSIQYGLTMG